MAETLNLTNPIPKPALSGYKVYYLGLYWELAKIEIVLTGTNGERFQHNYNGEEATALMRILNTANLSANSLHKRILNKLISDGVIQGAVAGAPD